MVFRDKYWFLSNMYKSPITMKIDGETYTFTCVEAAFQAHKCPERADEFVGIDGFEAKKQGRKVALRSDWESIKENVMLNILRVKFQNERLAEMLRNVSEPIVEDNKHGDTYWGKCNGYGKNRLGILLEMVKAEIS